MKIYVVTDLEGVAGITQWDPRHKGDTPATAATRAKFAVWLAEEVNAAARGFFAGGATEVIVNDGHGAGNTMDLEVLDRRITLFHGTQRPDYCTGLDETCDALASVGTHAMGGTRYGNLAHTMGRGVRYYELNGTRVGETGYQAFLAGYYGVPYIFCAGDEWAIREMQQLCPGCIGAATKIGTGPLSALTCPPARAREIIEEGARRAMSVIGQVKPLKLDSPVVFREEHDSQLFDEERELPDRRVINSHTQEIEAETILDVMNIKYGHDPDWKPIWRQ